LRSKRAERRAQAKRVARAALVIASSIRALCDAGRRSDVHNTLTAWFGAMSKRPVFIEGFLDFRARAAQHSMLAIAGFAEPVGFGEAPQAERVREYV
jgi:hypothetical protein